MTFFLGSIASMFIYELIWLVKGAPVSALPFGYTFLASFVALVALIFKHSSRQSSEPKQSYSLYVPSSNEEYTPSQPTQQISHVEPAPKIEVSKPAPIIAEVKKVEPVQRKQVEIVKPKLSEQEMKSIALKNLFTRVSNRRSLHEKLYILRREITRELGSEANLTLHSDSISEIAALMPKTLHELERIKGIGQVRIHKYGKKIIQLVQNHMHSRFHPRFNIKAEVVYMGGSKPGLPRVLNIIRYDEKYFYAMPESENSIKTYLIEKVADFKLVS